MSTWVEFQVIPFVYGDKVWIRHPKSSISLSEFFNTDCDIKYSKPIDCKIIQAYELSTQETRECIRCFLKYA